MPYQATNGLGLRHQLSNAVAGAIDTPRSLRAQIIPLSYDGHPGRSQAVKVENYDQRGIKFQHPLPLHDRRVLVFLEGISLGRMAAEVDLSCAVLPVQANTLVAAASSNWWANQPSPLGLKVRPRRLQRDGRAGLTAN
jgi:hypothetical protein